MTFATYVPANTISFTGLTFPSGAFHAVLADADPDTYGDSNSTAEVMFGQVDVPITPPPAGHRVVYVQAFAEISLRHMPGGVSPYSDPWLHVDLMGMTGGGVQGGPMKPVEVVTMASQRFATTQFRTVVELPPYLPPGGTPDERLLRNAWLRFTQRMRIFGFNALHAAKVHRAWVNVLTTAPPTVNIVQPGATVDDTTVPLVRWAYSADPGAGRTQYAYEMRVYTDDAAAVPGFLDTIADVWGSGTVVSADREAFVGESLAPGAGYVVALRAAQQINGDLHWSDWDTQAFDVTVDAPDAPTVTAVALDDFGRVRVTIDLNAEHADAVELQRSFDGGATWQSPPEAAAPESVLAYPYVLVYNDFEVGNGVTVRYRARSTVAGEDFDVSGPWGETGDVQWSDSRVWIKVPGNPVFDYPYELMEGSLAEVGRDSDRGVFEVIGRSTPVVVSGKRKSRATTVRLGIATDHPDPIFARERLLHLLDVAEVVQVQAPDSFGGGGRSQWNNAYVVVGDVAEQRPIPRIDRAERIFVLPVREVDYVETLGELFPSDNPDGATVHERGLYKRWYLDTSVGGGV